jgi:hypothetical protein
MMIDAFGEEYRAYINWMGRFSPGRVQEDDHLEPELS